MRYIPARKALPLHNLKIGSADSSSLPGFQIAHRRLKFHAGWIEPQIKPPSYRRCLISPFGFGFNPSCAIKYPSYQHHSTEIVSNISCRLRINLIVPFASFRILRFDHSLRSNFSNRIRYTLRIRDYENDVSTWIRKTFLRIGG